MITLFRNIRHAFRVILKEEGGFWSGCLYRGIFPTLCGIAPYVGLNFAVYETLKGDVTMCMFMDDTSIITPTLRRQFQSRININACWDKSFYGVNPLWFLGYPTVVRRLAQSGPWVSPLTHSGSIAKSTILLSSPFVGYNRLWSLSWPTLVHGLAHSGPWVSPLLFLG